MEPARPSLFLTLLAALIALASCGQLLGGKAEIPQKRRFTIAVEPIQRYLEDSKRPYKATVQLQTFDIAGAYSLGEIVSRHSPYELRRDPQHVWGQRPRDMITDVVGKYFRNAQLFTRLTSARDLLDQRPDYVLSGTVGALERFDSGDRWFARILLSMQLVRQEDGQVIWRGEITADDEIEVFDADMQYTVQSMSGILRRKMEQFIRQLDSLFLHMHRSPGSPELVDLPADTARTVRVDTAAAQPAAPDYYELIPGKLAPE
jgi:ABC-type uncharacterized transport system auxiliary subunit